MTTPETVGGRAPASAGGTATRWTAAAVELLSCEELAAELNARDNRLRVLERAALSARPAAAPATTPDATALRGDAGVQSAFAAYHAARTGTDGARYPQARLRECEDALLVAVARAALAASGPGADER